MKDFKILKIKSGSIIQKALSLKNELGFHVELKDYTFRSQVRNSKGELLATATFTVVDAFTSYLTYPTEETLKFITGSKMKDVLYMDIMIIPVLNPEFVIHSETIKLEVERGITEREIEINP